MVRFLGLLAGLSVMATLVLAGSPVQAEGGAPCSPSELQFGTCGVEPDTDPTSLRDFGQISLLTPRRYNVVSGYVVDPGASAEVDGDGVGYVELLVDGAILYNSVTDCFFDHTTGGMTNCYSVFRPDVAINYPTLKDSVHGGFRFVLDLSQLMNLGLYTPGRFAWLATNPRLLAPPIPARRNHGGGASIHRLIIFPTPRVPPAPSPIHSQPSGRVRALRPRSRGWDDPRQSYYRIRQTPRWTNRVSRLRGAGARPG